MFRSPVPPTPPRRSGRRDRARRRVGELAAELARRPDLRPRLEPGRRPAGVLACIAPGHTVRLPHGGEAYLAANGQVWRLATVVDGELDALAAALEAALRGAADGRRP